MAASTATRSTWTDDDGSGSTGSIINNAELQKVYDAMDLLFSGGGSYTTFTLGGKARVEGAGVTVKGAASPGVSAAGEGLVYFDSTSNTFMQSQNGGAIAALVSPMSLLRSASGTDASVGATNVDTVAISGLTVLDTLLVFVTGVTTAGSATFTLYNNTDAVVMRTSPNSTTTTLGVATEFRSRRSQQSNTSIHTTSESYDASSVLVGGFTIASFATGWTGSWTLALRHGGVSGGGTLQWSWAAFKVAGQ